MDGIEILILLLNWSINQSKQIYIVPYFAIESEAHKWQRLGAIFSTDIIIIFIIII